MSGPIDEPGEPLTPDEPAAAPDAERAAQPDPRAATRASVAYKGAPLEAERGPGLGCFWLQIIVLVIVIVLTPLSAAWEWPVPVTIVLMVMMLVLLLLAGQTIIFLLRLVAADRRAPGRRRPMRSETKTVGEIEDESRDEALGEPGDDMEDESRGVRE